MHLVGPYWPVQISTCALQDLGFVGFFSSPSPCLDKFRFLLVGWGQGGRGSVLSQGGLLWIGTVSLL